MCLGFLMSAKYLFNARPLPNFQDGEPAEHRLKSWTLGPDQVQTQAIQLTGCVPSGKWSTSLCCNFLICEMGVVLVPTSLGCPEHEMSE